MLSTKLSQEKYRFVYRAVLTRCFQIYVQLFEYNVTFNRRELENKMGYIVIQPSTKLNKELKP